MNLRDIIQIILFRYTRYKYFKYKKETCADFAYRLRPSAFLQSDKGVGNDIVFLPNTKPNIDMGGSVSVY